MKLLNNKRYIFICGGLAVIILVSLIVFGINRIQTGKSRQKDSNTSSQGAVTAAYLNACYGEDGYFWMGDDELLHYTDGSSGKETVACSLPGCEHEPYDEQSNPDPVCQADAHSVLTMAQNGKYLYLIKAEDTQETSVDYVLYRQNVNGEDRKKLMDLPGTAEMTFSRVICDGRNIAVSYTVSYTEEDGELKELDESIAGVYLINIDNLQTQDFKASAEETSYHDCNISGISLENNKLYYAMSYCDEKYTQEEMDAKQQEEYEAEHYYTGIGIYDIDQQTTEGIEYDQMDGGVILKGNLCLYQSRDGILQYRYIDNRESAIRDGDDSKCHLSREETECVLYAPEQGSTEHISYSVKGIMGDHVYYSYYDEKTDTETWYQYDSATGKTETFSPEKNLSVAYLSDQYVYLWVLDDTGVATGYKCVTEDTFLAGKLDQSQTEGKSQKSGSSQRSADEKNLVVWGYDMSSETFTEETVNQLNEYLKKQGCDYQVQLKKIDKKTNDKKSILEKYPEVDILQMPSDDYNTNRSIKMIQDEYYMPLTSYLQNEGKELQEEIPDELWEQVRIDGEIYTVPNTSLDYQGLYFQFNPAYVSETDIQNFDGTLQGVDDILKKADTSAVSYPLLMAGLVEFSYADLTGCMYAYGLALPEDGSQIVPWYQADGVKAFYQQMNAWYRKGYLADQSFSIIVEGSELAAKAKAYEQGDYIVRIGFGRPDAEKGTVCYGLIYLHTKLGLSTGVSAASDNPEQALDFLQRAYTDSKVANMMIYGIEGETYVREGNTVKLDDPEADIYLENRLGFGNDIKAMPSSDDGYTDRRQDMTAYFQQNNKLKNSRYLSFEPDVSEYTDLIAKLYTQQESGENMWSSEDFEEEYQSLIKDTVDCSKYVKEIKRQVEKWEKNQS